MKILSIKVAECEVILERSVVNVHVHNVHE